MRRACIYVPLESKKKDPPIDTYTHAYTFWELCATMASCSIPTWRPAICRVNEWIILRPHCVCFSVFCQNIQNRWHLDSSSFRSSNFMVDILKNDKSQSRLRYICRQNFRDLLPSHITLLYLYYLIIDKEIIYSKYKNDSCRRWVVYWQLLFIIACTIIISRCRYISIDYYTRVKNFDTHNQWYKTTLRLTPSHATPIIREE